MEQQERAEQHEKSHAESEVVLPPLPTLPIAPDGYVWVESSVSTLQGTAHLAKRDAKLPRALCKIHLRHIGMLHPLSAPCAECLRIAAKPKRARKPKTDGPPPTILHSSQDLLAAIGAFSFAAVDDADLGAVAGRVGPIRKALADYVVAKLGRDPTPDDVAAVVARVKELPEFYRAECKDASPPATPDTFKTWYLKLLAKRGTNGNGTGARYVWRGKEWPVYEGRVHVEIMPNVHRNVPASAAYWQAFLEEMDEKDKHDATVALERASARHA